MSLAIFDLDNTLIAGDSDHAWGEFLAAKGIVDDDYRQRNERFYQQYIAGTLAIEEYLAFAAEPLRNRSMSQLQRWHQQFMAKMIAPLLLPKAAAILDKHRQHGDCLLIITSTNRFVTAPIARSLGVDHLLATDLEVKNHRYTGAIAGTPCFQAGKVERLHQWLNEQGQSLQGSYGYSDSHNDIALLEVVDHPYAVDPDAELETIAKQRGWPVISFRE